MAPIRVLQVVGKMHFGGMETLIMNIYRNIDREKVQFDFLVHYDDPGEYDNEIRRLGGKIYVMPRTVPQNYFKYKKALHKFFSEHPEYKVVHGHLHSVAFIYQKIAKQHGVKYCITHSHNDNHDQTIKGFISYYTSLLAEKHTDIYFGCSKAACEKFFPRAARQSREMTVIKNGVEPQKYVYDPAVREAVRKSLDLQGQLVIGHIGRFWPQKNHAFLLDIFAEVHRKSPQSTLLLVGEGPLKGQVQQKAADLGLQEHIRFLGARDDVDQLLQAMDVFLLPSLFEGLAVVLIESQAAGLPIVASGTVTKEAAITDYIKYVDLKYPVSAWSDTVIVASQKPRRDTSGKIRSAGFDIVDTAKKLESFYIQLSSK